MLRECKSSFKEYRDERTYLAHLDADPEKWRRGNYKISKFTPFQVID